MAKWETGEGSLIPRVFQSNPHFDVMIVTELTAAGRKAPVASPAQPVYYSGADGGQVAIGDLIGGDEAPKPADLASLLARSLRAGGYLPAAAGHPPAGARPARDQAWGRSRPGRRPTAPRTKCRCAT
jgi:hypothetical protein